MRVLIFLLLQFTLVLGARSQQANYWIFGTGGEGIDFNTDPPTIIKTTDLNASHGTASICDEKGNLLLYTDGKILYNAKDDTIADGLLGNRIAIQSSIFIPNKTHPNIIYLFTASAFEWYHLKENVGYFYSVIDLNLNNGKGGILKKNIKLHDNSTVKLTAIQSVDCDLSWVVTLPFDEDAYYAYKIDENGVDETPVISKVGKHMKDAIFRQMGSIKISPDGKKMANSVRVKQYYDTQYYGWLELFDFDMGTGIISNPKMIFDANVKHDVYQGFFSVAFSPDGKLLYACQGGNPPVQVDVYSENLEPVQFTEYKFRRLELGPYDKIYGILDTPELRKDSIYYLEKAIAAIHKPNMKGELCEVEPYYIVFDSTTTIHSLPNFPQSFFYNDSLVIDYNYSSNCLGEETQFNIDLNYPVNEYWWDFGDPASGHLNVSYDSDPLHRFQSPGKYEVNLYSIDICKRRDVVSKDVILYPDPVFDIPFDTLQRCWFEEPFIPDLPKYEFTDYFINHKLAGDTIQINQRGDYLVTLSNECFTQEDQFFYDLVPELIPPLATDTFFCAGEAGVLSARNDLAFYDWNTGETTKEIEVYDDGEYEVTLNSACQTISDKTSVKFIDKDIKKNAINVFTPNGDGFNEVFENYAVHSPNYRTQIFNRYGTLLFETKNPDIFWDGFVNGKPAVSGVYYYYTETMNCQAEPITIKGAFSLLK